MNEKNNLMEKFVVKDKRWVEEWNTVIETINKAHLRIARILFRKNNPPKRCVAFSKNRKSIAWDIEMSPLVVSFIIKASPKKYIPKEFMTPELEKVWDMLGT